MGGFNTSLLSAEDTDLAMRLGALEKIAYDPNMCVSISARKAREGYGIIVRRAGPEFVRIVVLGKPPTGGDFVAIR